VSGILAAIGQLLAPILKEIAAVFLERAAGPKVSAVKDAEPVLAKITHENPSSSLIARWQKETT